MKDQIHCQTSFAPAAAAIRRGCSPLGLLRRQARSMPASAWKGPHNAMRMWPDGLHAARFQRLCTSGWAPQHCYGSPQLAPDPPQLPSALCSHASTSRHRQRARRGHDARGLQPGNPSQSWSLAAVCSLPFIPVAPWRPGRRAGACPIYGRASCPPSSWEGGEGAEAPWTRSKWHFSKLIRRKQPGSLGASSQLRAQARVELQHLCIF